MQPISDVNLCAASRIAVKWYNAFVVVVVRMKEQRRDKSRQALVASGCVHVMLAPVVRHSAARDFSPATTTTMGWPACKLCSVFGAHTRNCRINHEPESFSSNVLQHRLPTCAAKRSFIVHAGNPFVATPAFEQHVRVLTRVARPRGVVGENISAQKTRYPRRRKRTTGRLISAVPCQSNFPPASRERLRIARVQTAVLCRGRFR